MVLSYSDPMFCALIHLSFYGIISSGGNTAGKEREVNYEQESK